jgi:tRNA A-37 threonylcarbamoyl transferase component Bud32
MIGMVLDGTYRVVERIGAGAMGEVYLVEHVHIGRREAIKVLRPEMARDPRLASRFRREARAINRLRHPNIIGIYDFGQLPDGRLYLTMEYAAGATLDVPLAREGRFDVARTVHLLHQLASAIDHAHGQGVVHRDLKPSNLILADDRSDVLKVLDFGLAKVLNPSGGDDQVTLMGELVGTPEYLAPERMAGGPDDPRSDLYAIGCIAYELLSGRPPFTGGRTMVMSAHLQTPPTPPSRVVPGIPPSLDALIVQLLAKSPAARPATGRALCAALEEVPGFPRKKVGLRTNSILTSAGVHGDLAPRATAQITAQQIGHADTASADPAEIRDEIFNALVELAQTTTVQCPGDDGLAITLALVHGVRDDRARIAGERVFLEERQARALQTAREREGSLRFAIAELRFERQNAAPHAAADLDYQIGQLESRVRELSYELRTELGRVEDRGIELATAEHDLESRWLDLHRRLRGNLANRLHMLGSAAQAISSRFSSVVVAVDDVLASAAAR